MTRFAAFAAATAATLFLASAGFAQGPGPLINGSGKEMVTAQIMDDVRRLVQATVGEETRDFWRLDTRAGAEDADSPPTLYRIEVYLTPRVANPRLLRGKSLVVVPQHDEIARRDALAVGGWSCVEPATAEFAIVAPLDGPSRFDGLAGEPFAVRGGLADGEIVPLFDALRTAAPEQRPEYFEARNDGSVHAHCESRIHGARNLEFDFRRSGDGAWVETKRSWWCW